MAADKNIVETVKTVVAADMSKVEKTVKADTAEVATEADSAEDATEIEAKTLYEDVRDEAQKLWAELHDDIQRFAAWIKGDPHATVATKATAAALADKAAALNEKTTAPTA